MIRMFARRTSVINVAANADQILFGISLPSDTVIHDIRAQVSVEASAQSTMGQVHMYAVEGWILPILDPDGAASYATLWDNLVPKDSDVQTLDLDTSGIDTTPFYEPGEADFSALVDVGLQPERLFERHRFITFGNSPVGYSITSADVREWWAIDAFQIHIGKRLRIRQPSVLLFGLASPSLDDHQASTETALAENEWHRVKYIEHVLEQGMSSLLGLIESGAETPWEDAVNLLQKHLEPDMMEGVTNAFVAKTWFATTQAIIDHSVVGAFNKMSISTGR